MYAYSLSAKRSVVVAVVVLAVLLSGQRAHAQPGWVLSHQEISDTQGGFTGILDDSDYFGSSVAMLGDVDGDGVGDLAVRAQLDENEGVWRGAVWLLFLTADGTANSYQRISELAHRPDRGQFLRKSVRHRAAAPGQPRRL